MLHQMLLSRLIAAASALIFSVLSFVAPPQRIANEGTVVRVGLYFGETAKRSVTVRASGGFTLGRAEEDGWTALLTTECETIVVSRRIARPVTGESRYKNASAAAEAAAQSGGTVLYENGAYAVAEGLSPADAEPLFVVADESGKPLFLYAGEEALTLAAGAAIEFPADETLYSYRGRIECIPDGTRFSVVNTVGLEDYVKGVLPWEIGANESDETTKAFAVLTRTAPLSGSKPAHLERGFDVCTGTCCQIYRGLARTDARLERLADETAGEVLTYEDRPAVVLYHTTSGGATCSLSEAWGGDDLPYLRSVDIGEPYEEAADGVWSEYLTMHELTERLRAYGGVFAALTGAVTELRVTATDRYRRRRRGEHGGPALFRAHPAGTRAEKRQLYPHAGHAAPSERKRLPDRRAHRRKRPRPRRGTQRHGRRLSERVARLRLHAHPCGLFPRYGAENTRITDFLTIGKFFAYRFTNRFLWCIMALNLR